MYRRHRIRPSVWLAVAGLLIVPLAGHAEESVPVERPASPAPDRPAERPAERAIPPERHASPADLDSVTLALLGTGDAAGALAHLERGLVTARASLPPEHPDLGAHHHRLGDLSWRTGDFERARTELEAALLIYERAHGPEHAPASDALGLLGSIALELGDVPGALAYHRRALAIAEKTAPSGPAVPVALDRLGLALHASGDAKAAREAHLRALPLFERAEGDSSIRVAACLHHLAADEQSLGDLEPAREHLLRARSILSDRMSAEHPGVAVSISGLASIAAAQEDPDRARAHRREAVAIRRRALGSEHPLLAEALAAYAGSLLRTGHNVEAVDAALEAETIRRNHLRFIARALPERQALRYEARLASGLGVAVAASIRTWDSTVVERVWDAAARSRALVLDEMASRHRWADLRADSATLALAAESARMRQSLAHLAVRGPEGMDPAVYRATLDRSRLACEEAERSLLARDPSVRPEGARAGAGLGEVRALLPAGTGLVSLIRYLDPTVARRRPAGSTAPAPGSAASPPGSRIPDTSSWSYAAFVTAGAGTHARAIPLGDAEELDSLVSAWRVAVESRRDANADVARERTLGRLLRQRLWDPIAPHLGNVRRVVLVPDGTFHLVNPMALRLDEDRFLVEDGPTFQIVSSERDLIGPANEAAPGTGFLVMADPDFDAPRSTMSSLDRQRDPDRERTPAGSGRNGAVYRGSRPCGAGAGAGESPWEPLPGSAREVEEVARLWEANGGGVPKVLRGAEATEGAFKKLAPGARALHLATHGFFAGACEGGENPLLRSGLVLAGANSRPVAGEDSARTEDGILTADEISALNLTGVESAVLSGCETGVGVVRAGEGVFGLRRAFEVAGVRTLVMTLWPVTDQAAREWTVRYYEARLTEGLDAASASHDASLGMLEALRARGEPGDPFAWAAFIAAGR